MSEFYNGNLSIKNCGVPVRFTAEQLDEYLKCKQDPIYFITTYLKTVSLDDGLVDFKLYPYQVKFIEAIHNNRRVISMQPRQSGKTQVVAAYVLWYTLFNDVKNVAILANKGATAREILSRYKLMYEFVPMYMQQGVKTWNKGSIELENNSAVFTGATNAAGIRSKSVNFLYMDEVAIIPNTVFDEFYASSWPTLSSGETTKIVMTSTPLGYNHFWKFWSEAETGANGFVPIRVTWQEHPKRDQKWADAQMSSLGKLKYTQEVDCAFLGSSDTLIDAGIISRLFGKPPIFQKDGLDIYEKPIKGSKELKTKDHSYVMVVDTGKGLGGDYSAFSLIDITEVPYKLVGKYRNNKIAPMLFPTVIHKVATDYNMAYVLFEINASEQVPHIMYYELEYENILFVSRGKKGQEVSAGFGGSTLQMGVSTDKKTKRIGCNNIKSIIEEGKLHIFDTDVIAEMSTFIQIKDSYAADDGYHDDLMMTLVLFGWLTTQAYFRDLGDVDLRKAMYQSRMDAIEEEQLPMGWFSNGIETPEVEVLNF